MTYRLTVLIWAVFIMGSSTGLVAAPLTLTTDMIKDTVIKVKVKDGEGVLDGELAGKNFKDTGAPRIGKKDDGLSRVLFRIDVSNLRLLELKNIERVRLVINYVYPSGNPTLGLYRITDEDADWKIDQATWKQKSSDKKWAGGPGGGDPGDGTYGEEPLDRSKADSHPGKAVFHIPSSVIRTWMEAEESQNPGLLLKSEDQGSVMIHTQGYPPRSSTHFHVTADWEVDADFSRNASGEVTLLGSGGIEKQLMEKTLQSALQEFNPNLHKVPADDIRGRWNRFDNAFRFVQGGGYDLVITSRRDWDERVPEEYKEDMTYVPVAKQLVYREREVAGGVEYGVVHRTDVWIPQVQAFVEFLRSPAAQERLAEKNHYLFAPADRKLPEFEPPSYWRDKPWETEKKPMMVHGVDFHGGNSTTVFSELTKMKMMGYNSVMFGGHSEKVMTWADENGMLISGMPEVTEEDRAGGLSRHAAAAKKMARHPSCWGAYLKNEDSASHWMSKMYRGDFDGKDEEKLSEREKAFHRIKNGGFAEWAREKHGTLEKLNKRWHTDYDSWDGITLPGLRLEEVADIYEGIIGPAQENYQRRQRFSNSSYTYAEYPDLLDLRRHCRAVWASWYDERIAEMRSYLGDGFLYSTKDGKDPYDQRASGQFNSAAHDHGPCKYASVELQILVDTVQTGRGWPVWNAEDHIYTHSNPRRVRFDIFSKYLMGQFKSTTYVWGSTGGRAVSHKRSTEHGRAEKLTRNKIRRYEPIFRAFLEARAEADLTVLITEANRAWDEYDPRPEESYLGGAIKAYGYMGALGRQWKYVLDRDISAESVQDVMVIDAPWLTDQTIERLSKLPSDRRLIAVGQVPNTNEYGEPLPESALNKVKKRATVIQDWPELSDVVKPADGLMEPYTAIGQGKYWTWNRFRGRGPWSFHLPTARLELRRVKHDGKLYLAVLNHADKAITAPIPWAEGREVRDLMSENPHESIKNTESHKFGKEDVALFELR